MVQGDIEEAEWLQKEKESMMIRESMMIGDSMTSMKCLWT
jgi:hypothetical protein